ncbi:DUF6143 family protein [Bacillus pseudomycoides]|uniref:DUF6143 family protein n=1 Tax=Bacillus pseudomycoides TaxID=64104 RepID=UPI0023DCA71E|nr:DUF6143 family protein [Bacillus pseudomycoides]MDF2085664.1 DUF6143 family protein [Bacillus pseudomycoides]
MVFFRLAVCTPLTSDEDGKFIFSCGESFIIFLISSDNEIIESEIAFGWFEKKI